MFDWLKWLNPANWPIFQDTPDGFIKKDLDKGIQAIPPGAVILFRDHGQVLSLGFTAKHGTPIIILNIKDPLSLFAWAIRVIKKQWSNHTEVYLGSGLHELVGARWTVVKRSLDQDLNMQSQFKIYVYKPLTVEQLSGLKGYLYGSLGKHYAADMLINTVTDAQDANPGQKDEVFCSELVVLAFQSQGIKTSGKAPDKSAPGDLGAYFDSGEGSAAGWVLYDTYNVGMTYKYPVSAG